jgi:hypothetical protein
VNPTRSKWLAPLCRWTARILGAVFLVFIVIMAIGEGMPNPLTQPALVQLGFLGLAIVMVGILAGWRWDLAAAIISLAGWCLFVLAVAILRKGPNPFVIALALPGLLLLASARLRRPGQRHSLS